MNERLRRMDDERIAKLEERVANWMETTTDYRRSLCTKLDKVMSKLDELPCPARVEQTKDIHRQLSSLWKIVWFTVPSIVGLAVTWGALTTTVADHSKDIDYLKNKSHEHRGAKVVPNETMPNP